MKECVLCGAIKERFRLISENRHSFCIICSEPLKEGHLMVLPKRHIESYSEMSENEALSLLKLIDQMTELVSKTYNSDVMNILNAKCHRTQKHLHIHIIPSRGNLRELFSKYESLPLRIKASKAELEKMKINILGKNI